MDKFIKLVKHDIKRKANLYDGHNSVTGMDKDIFKMMSSVTEEAGEIASAINRERYELAMSECVNLAQVTFVLFKAIEIKLASNDD